MDKGTVQRPVCDRVACDTLPVVTARPALTSQDRAERLFRRSSRGKRRFIEKLIARSGFINRAIMRIYQAVDVRGLERWRAKIERQEGRLRRLNLYTYWSMKALERLSAVYIGGLLTAREQRTFGMVCGLRDYRMSRYHALVFGSLTGALYFSSGSFAFWMGGRSDRLGEPWDLTAACLFGMGAFSISMDLFRVVDSFVRKKAHMPLGVVSLLLNSPSIVKHYIGILRRKRI